VLAPSELPELANASIPENWVKKKWGTYIVDLRQDVDSLWNNLKKSARKAIRTAREDGITVRRMRSLDELRAYYDFVRRCSPRYGKEAYGFADWERLWRLFRPTGVFETFLAEKSDKPLAGLSVWGYGGNISEFGSYQSEESFREKLYGNDLIKWEVISWGVRNGQRTFDLAGVNPEPQSPKEQGIRQFKEKWGGRYQEYVVVSWNRKE
jgi:lipid II:glycine glycyltransferase (peptidoglycan interpeptide bridge formation enzyme)